MPTISARPGETIGIRVANAINGNAMRAARLAGFAALHSERQAGDDLIPFSGEFALSLASIISGQTTARSARLGRFARFISRRIPYAASQLVIAKLAVRPHRICDTNLEMIIPRLRALVARARVGLALWLTGSTQDSRRKSLRSA